MYTNYSSVEEGRRRVIWNGEVKFGTVRYMGQVHRANQ
jgi:hypothetical protein